MRKIIKQIIALGLMLMMLVGCASKENVNEKAEDREAPVIEISSYVLFTNNIDNPDYTNVFEVRDGSECKLSLCKFVKLDELKVLDEASVKYYTDALETKTTEELLERTDDLPDGEGIYSAIFVAEDAFGHKSAKEVIVVYDTQKPLVDGLEDLDTEITVDNLEEEWTDTLVDELSISDNVDGIITSSMMDVQMTPSESEDNAYDVKAAYTDRAGNGVSIEYTITLKEKAEETPQTNTGGGNTNTGNTDTGNGQTATTPQQSSSDPGYSYEDRDGDGYADLGETTVMNGYVCNTSDMSPSYAKSKLALANAGLYNIVYTDYEGGSYWVLVEPGQSTRGFEMLDAHLASMGLTWEDMAGGWFDVNTTVEYCVVFGSDIYPIE